MAAHRGTRAQTVLVILVILVICIIGLYCYFEFWRTDPSEPEQLVNIRVDLSESGEWQSDLTDSPLYISAVTYVISNHGTGTAEGIQATISIDDVVFDEFSLASLASNDSFAEEFSVSIDFDSSKEISLTASCGNSTDTGVLTVNAFLDRTFSPDLASLYITPSDSIIQQTLDEIVNNPLHACPTGQDHRQAESPKRHGEDCGLHFEKDEGVLGEEIKTYRCARVRLQH